MSPYDLHCTVCKDSFKSSLDWNAHLPQINHQRRARLACRKWTASVKACVLVAFGSCPVVDCNLIQVLSGGIPSLVTDFIYWKKKPNVGFVHFESRNKLEDVLRRTNAEVRVGDNIRVQLKRAVDYLELEWNVLLSLNTGSNEEQFICNDDNFTPSTVKIEPNSSCPEIRMTTKTRTKSSTNKYDEIIPSTKQKNKACTFVEDDMAPSIKSKKKRKKIIDHENQDEETSSKKKKKSLKNDKDDRNAAIKKSKEVKSINYEELYNPTSSKKSKKASLSKSDGRHHPINSKIIVLQSSSRKSCLVNFLEDIPASQETFSKSSYQETYYAKHDNLRPKTSFRTMPKLAVSDTYSTGTEVITLSSDNGSDLENVSVTLNKQGALQTNPKNDNQKLTDNNNNNNNKEITSKKAVKNIKSMDSLMQTKDFLPREYVSLWQDILIPKDQYENALNLIDTMEREFKKTVPECRIIPFRHWYLGIKSAGNNELLLFLDYSGLWEQNRALVVTLRAQKPSIIKTFLQSPELVFPDLQVLPERLAKQSSQDEENSGLGCVHKPSGLKFRFICSLSILHEVQTCRLVKYLCEFNPHVLPLLGVINYWANLNCLMVGNLRVTNPSKPSISPFPASLNWLVLLYLMKKRFIPSVKHVFLRPHKRMNVCGRDMGFSDDPKYPQTWSSSSTKPHKLHEQIAHLRNIDINEFYSLHGMLKMLKILKGFFSFYCNRFLRQGCNQGVILNTRNGNLIGKSDVQSERNSKKITFSKLERKLLKEQRWFTENEVSILHPINFTKFSLSFHSKIFRKVHVPLMDLTRQKIRQILSMYKKGKMPQINFSELLKVDRNDIVEEHQAIKKIKEVISKRKKARKAMKTMHAVNKEMKESEVKNKESYMTVKMR